MAQETQGRSGPLAGLTKQEADKRIEAKQAQADRLKASHEAARDELKQMKADRKTLDDPQPAGNGTRAQAQAAELRTQGGAG
jgi:hypothetical protein